jgi:hypothetical protein
MGVPPGEKRCICADGPVDKDPIFMLAKVDGIMVPIKSGDMAV